ncbi:Protein of unknown function [Pyronema omphalodes CBS 100304]|uniref:Uncharacterized protein n=1 Tax=Pyronema omphalodes (strain CBS 100304) TaxID=1076935 RepID=U4LSM6_PYROM|nr:Protein of unknown function [Pyronema omphalodes CBS 100304]
MTDHGSPMACLKKTLRVTYYELHFIEEHKPTYTICRFHTTKDMEEEDSGSGSLPIERVSGRTLDLDCVD